jgi:hypothetical protein
MLSFLLIWATAGAITLAMALALAKSVASDALRRSHPVTVILCSLVGWPILLGALIYGGIRGVIKKG